MSTAGAGPFHFSVKVSHAEISFHQRLESRIEITLDGRDLENRRGHGRLLVLAQITDSEGKRYQDHVSMELNKLEDDVKDANLEYSFPAFFLPGDYNIDIAFVNTSTDEHGAKKVQFRVVEPRHEYLSDAWRGLPAVEFIGDKDSPDSWYLPSVHGRVQWAASVHAPAQLNVILNVVPAAQVPGSRSSSGRDLSALLPTLKIVSQTGSSSISEHVELLDLARQRTAFQQSDGRDLDWPRLRASLGEANTASIDVHSLSGQRQDAQFFVSQVRKIMRDSNGPCVLAVLTKSVTFASGEDLEPISLEGLPACRVFYIRFHVLLRSVVPFDRRQMGGRGRSMRMDGAIPQREHPQIEAIDQLEATLKPLKPKVFDVETPEQIAKAIAEIEKEL
ncbi:MAG TPA: hypothetical protein VHZ07_03470 [Bryobacteraceae bacterium]|nr:hypothetical protein [Bryobacteraceae bacterium]